MNKLNQFVTDEKGIQHAEEALLLALVAVALVTGVKALTTGINGVFGRAVTGMA